jgi:hypothetical protein
MKHWWTDLTKDLIWIFSASNIAVSFFDCTYYFECVFIMPLFSSLQSNLNARHLLVLMQIGYSGYPLNDENRRFVILHAVLHTNDNGCFAEVLCIHVDSNPLAAADDSAPSFITKLEWLTFYSGGSL